MSLKYEQCNALLKTRAFLMSIIHGPAYKTRKELKDMAYSYLKHFPMLKVNGLPIFSSDCFTDKNGKAVNKTKRVKTASNDTAIQSE